MQFTTGTEIHRSKIFFLELNRERRMEENSKWERNLRQENQNKNYRTSFADFHIFGQAFSENGIVVRDHFLFWRADFKISENFFEIIKFRYSLF